MSTAVNTNIKNFRTFKGITQDDLAKRIGKSKNVISNWERGDNSPDLDSVAKICVELDVTPTMRAHCLPPSRWESCKQLANNLQTTSKQLANKFATLFATSDVRKCIVLSVLPVILDRLQSIKKAPEVTILRHFLGFCYV